MCGGWGLAGKWRKRPAWAMRAGAFAYTAEFVVAIIRMKIGDYSYPYDHLRDRIGKTDDAAFQSQFARQHPHFF